MAFIDEVKGGENKTSNPFKSNNRNNNRSTNRNTNYNKNTSSNSTGKYVPPGARQQRQGHRQQRQGHRQQRQGQRQQRHGRRENTEVKTFKTKPIFKQQEGDFPELGNASKQTNTSSPNDNSSPNTSWTAIVTNEEEAEKPPPPPRSPVQPGWVRMSRNKANNNIIVETGATSQRYRSFVQNNRRQDNFMQYITNEKRLQNYKDEDDIRGFVDGYIYNCEVDEYKHHMDWLQRLNEDDLISDDELSEEDSDITSDND